MFCLRTGIFILPNPNEDVDYSYGRILCRMVSTRIDVLNFLRHKKYINSRNCHMKAEEFWNYFKCTINKSIYRLEAFFFLEKKDDFGSLIDVYNQKNCVIFRDRIEKDTTS